MRLVVVGGARPKAAAKGISSLTRTRVTAIHPERHVVVCYCKISLRGYEAASVLEASSWTNVKVMEGGIMAWPFEREDFHRKGTEQ